MRSRTTFAVVLVLLVIGLAAMLALAGCGSEDTETTAPGPRTETTAAAASFDGEIVLGALASQTGANAMTGAEMKWAYERAVSDINALGGVDVGGKKMELKLKFVDDKTEATEGAAAVEKLIKVEGLKLILGTNITPINLAAGLVAEKYEAYYQISTSWTDYIAAQNFKWVSDIFFTPAAAVGIPFGVASLLPEADQPKAWCMLTEDNTDGQGLAEGAVAIGTEMGFNIALSESYTPGTKDFSSIILKLKENNIDAVIVLISPADGITFVKQMKEQNYSPAFIFGWKGFWPTEFMTALGPDSDYMGHDGFWSEDNGAPGSKELGEAFKAEHDGLDSVSIGLSYASVQIMAQAISQAGSTDPAAVRDAVFGGSFAGTTMGDVTYAENGICDVEPYGLWWKNGERVVYWPDAGNTWEAFVPWDQR